MAAPVTISFTARLPPEFAELQAMLGDAGRQTIHEGVAAKVHALVQSWLKTESGSRHGTANRLGAQPTGHLEKAAQSVFMSATPAEAAVTVHSPGIQRAVRDIDIYPREAKALTIPMHALAYGRRASEVEESGDLDGSIFRPKGTSHLMGIVGGVPTLLYILRKHVRQRRDRTLLPPDDQLGKAAETGAANAILRALGES